MLDGRAVQRKKVAERNYARVVEWIKANPNKIQKDALIELRMNSRTFQKHRDRYLAERG